MGAADRVLSGSIKALMRNPVTDKCLRERTYVWLQVWTSGDFDEAVNPDSRGAKSADAQFNQYAQDSLIEPEDEGCGDAAGRHDGVCRSVVAGVDPAPPPNQRIERCTN